MRYHGHVKTSWYSYICYMQLRKKKRGVQIFLKGLMTRPKHFDIAYFVEMTVAKGSFWSFPIYARGCPGWKRREEAGLVYNILVRLVVTGIYLAEAADRKSVSHSVTFLGIIWKKKNTLGSEEPLRCYCEHHLQSSVTSSSYAHRKLFLSATFIRDAVDSRASS